MNNKKGTEADDGFGLAAASSHDRKGCGLATLHFVSLDYLQEVTCARRWKTKEATSDRTADGKGWEHQADTRTAFVWVHGSVGDLSTFQPFRRAFPLFRGLAPVLHLTLYLFLFVLISFICCLILMSKTSTALRPLSTNTAQAVRRLLITTELFLARHRFP